MSWHVYSFQRAGDEVRILEVLHRLTRLNPLLRAFRTYQDFHPIHSTLIGALQDPYS